MTQRQQRATARTSRQTPEARRADRNLVVIVAGAGVVELVAWSMAWMLDWQLGALVGAVAVSLGVGVAAVLMLGRKRR